MYLLRRLKITRRGIQIALGALWLLDGLLQLQPRMFSADFANDVILPAAQGQPGFVSGPMQFFAHIFLIQPFLFNALIALVQISLGVLILWRRTAKIGLWGSIVWGLFVWFIGEGLSGLASGHTLLLMGAPGAALLYALLAVGTISFRSNHARSSDTRPAYFLLVFWVLFWVMGSVYQLLPGQNAVSSVGAMVATNASSAPSWMAAIDNNVVAMLDSVGTAPVPMDTMEMTPAQMAAMPTHQVSGLWFLILLSFVQIVIGFGAIIPGFMRRFAVTLGCTLAITYWVVGQSMGSYFSGLATDPNSGPLFVLLGIALLGCTQQDEKVRSFFRRIKERFLAEARAFNEA